MRKFLTLAALVCSVVLLTDAGVKKRFDTRDIVGAWYYVTSYIDFPDGHCVYQFGRNPQGIFILLPGGWYQHVIMENTLPRFSSGQIKDPTVQEAQRSAAGTLAHMGTWTFDERTGVLTAHVYKSSFPNFDGQTQRRQVRVLNRERLEYVNFLSTGGDGAFVHAKLRRLTESTTIDDLAREYPAEKECEGPRLQSVN